MSAAELLLSLDRRGVTLFVEGDRLRFRATKPETYTATDRAAVAQVRPELMRLLAARDSLPGREERATDCAAEAQVETAVTIWDQTEASRIVAGLIARKEASGYADVDALRQRQFAAGDEVDRCFVEKDMVALRRAAVAFASLFNAQPQAVESAKS